MILVKSYNLKQIIREMKLYYWGVLFFLVSCSPRYLSIKELVQRNCERYVALKDIRVSKRDNYYVANILRDSVYSNIYYFVIYGHQKDDIVIVADDKKYYWMKDSLCKRIIDVNNQLASSGKSIVDIYTNERNSFAIRAMDTEKKYLYDVVDVKAIDDILNVNFEYSGNRNASEE